ncbi:MAG: hypothetical protein WCJ02_00010 [bacterium]
MSTTEICPVCRAPNTTRQSAGANTVELHCPRCGRFQIQALAETQLLNNRPAFPPTHLLSGLCRNMWDILNDKLLITVDLFKSWTELDAAAKVAVPRDTDLGTKSEYLMRFMRRKSKSLAETVVFTPNELSVGFCANKNELLFCLKYLAEKGLIEEDAATKQQQGFPYRLTPAGWATLDSYASSQEKVIAMVCLIPGKEPDLFWTQGISAGITLAGLSPVRADSKECANKITDEIIVGIRKAYCVVADLTGQSQLVYFQAGLAIGLGKPVFWTCEATELADKKLMVDTRQQIITPWTRDKLPEFATRLAARIIASRG